MRLIIPLLLTLFLCAGTLGHGAMAQILPAKEQAETATEAEKPKDPLGRETPQGTMKGFLQSVADEDYEQASQYLDLSALSRADRSNGAEYARNLQTLMDRQGWLAPDNKLSDKPEGYVEDHLEENVDNAGTLRAQKRTTEINLTRSENANGNMLWFFAADFVKQIPELSRNLNATLLDRIMIGKLDSLKFRGAPVGHWLAMIALYGFSYLVSGVFVRGFIRIIRRIFRKKNADAPSEHHLIDAFQTPLRLYVMLWLAALLALFIGVSVIVRQTFMPVSMAVGWIAAGLFFWRLVNVVGDHIEGRMKARERYNMSSMLAFSRRAAKFLFVVLIGILVLDSFGVDITAALAALGIGGIALALGAQKTLENFIGSLSIIVDQPMHVGDGCKIGDTVGVVEDIGMRSTRIRTNDKTLVTIPNGDLSVQRIENYAKRASFLINRQMILRYDSTSAQIREFIEKATAILKAQEKIDKADEMVRLLGFSDNGYAVQIWCYVKTKDGNEFLRTQAEITYAIIDAAKETGIYFAIPSQTFLPAKDQTGRIDVNGHDDH